MTRDRYFELRHRPQLVNELDKTEEDKKEDLLWHIRPLIPFSFCITKDRYFEIAHRK